MPAPSSLGTPSPAPTPSSSRETLAVVWIGDPQGIEKKLPAIAPHVQVSAQTADSAIEVLQAGSADAEVVVIDTTSAGVDAPGILERMKAAGLDLPVVLLATSGTGRVASEANQLAVCDVVVKIPGFEQQLPAAFSEVRARHDLVAILRESRQSQDRLRAILEFQPAVVGVISPDGNLGAMNQAGLSLIGAAQEQVVGRNVTTFLPPEQGDELLNLVRRVCKGEAGALDHSVLRADGTTVDVRTQAVPFQNNQGNIALVTIEKRSGASAAELASLAGRSDTLAAALEEARAHLDKLRAERTSESARADALTSELAESAAALALERERSRHQLAEAGTSNADALSSLTERCNALTASLAEATAQLGEVRAEHAKESKRAEVASSELADSVAALNQERERSQHLLTEMGTTNAEALSSLTVRCDALSAELTEMAATLKLERERSQQVLADMATTNANEQASLKEQADAALTSLREAHAQLDEVRAESAGISARAEALSSQLGESVSALELEREKADRLLGELVMAKSMVERSSGLEALLEADQESMKALREQLRRFTADADRLCSEMIDRHQTTFDQDAKVPA